MVQRDSQLPTQVRSGHLEFLLTAAAWQDSLLQAYRTLLLSSQALLFALALALFAADLAMNSAVRVYIASCLVLAIAIAGSYAHWRLQGVVRSRGQDVDFWHEEILLCETSLPAAERAFTRFKFRQQDKALVPDSARPRDALPEEYRVSDLTGAGIGYTRNLVDRHVARTLVGGWFLVAVGVVGYMAVVAISGAQ